MYLYGNELRELLKWCEVCNSFIVANLLNKVLPVMTHKWDPIPENLQVPLVILLTEILSEWIRILFHQLCFQHIKLQFQVVILHEMSPDIDVLCPCTCSLVFDYEDATFIVFN